MTETKTKTKNTSLSQSLLYIYRQIRLCFLLTDPFARISRTVSLNLCNTAICEKQGREMASPKEHIEEIRRNKFSIGGSPNPLTEDLHQAVKNLSAELYAKDVHFLMELIQVLLILFPSSIYFLSHLYISKALRACVPLLYLCFTFQSLF